MKEWKWELVVIVEWKEEEIYEENVKKKWRK